MDTPLLGLKHLQMYEYTVENGQETEEVHRLLQCVVKWTSIEMQLAA